MPHRAIPSRAGRLAHRLRTIAACCLVGILSIASSGQLLAAESEAPPNIVFIMADENDDSAALETRMARK